MSNNSTVGEKIKTLRENKNMSREELSQQSGLSVEQINHIEDNTDLPALALLVKIARALGVRLGTFLDDQEELGPVITRCGQQKLLCRGCYRIQYHPFILPFRCFII